MPPEGPCAHADKTGHCNQCAEGEPKRYRETWTNKLTHIMHVLLVLYPAYVQKYPVRRDEDLAYKSSRIFQAQQTKIKEVTGVQRNKNNFYV